MASSIPSTKLSQSAATSTTLQTGGKPEQVVAGEQSASVTVQSQMATSTVDGKGASRSNLSQVVADLGAAHNAHSGWAEAESQKINEWGTQEIARLMQATKGVEERLVAEAQGQQRLLEETHKVKLSKAVQELDADKAKRLKELEDGLQRQIQAALTQSKNDINAIESEMNNRKMALLQQQQLRGAKDIDRLSNLAVEAKLVPSITRTVIETNTETGTVIAVAAGGSISTGQASQQTVSSKNIEAVPMPGVLNQASDVRTGDIVTNNSNVKVGEGAIVNTQTTVTQAKQEGETLNRGTQQPIQQQQTQQTMPAQHTTSSADQHKHIDAAYGKPMDHNLHSSKLDAAKQAAVATYTKHSNEHSAVGNADYNKHNVDATGTGAHKEGLLAKVKHAITGEPKSTDATKRV